MPRRRRRRSDGPDPIDVILSLVGGGLGVAKSIQDQGLADERMAAFRADQANQQADRARQQEVWGIFSKHPDLAGSDDAKLLASLGVPIEQALGFADSQREAASDRALADEPANVKALRLEREAAQMPGATPQELSAVEVLRHGQPPPGSAERALGESSISNWRNRVQGAEDLRNQNAAARERARIELAKQESDRRAEEARRQAIIDKIPPDERAKYGTDTQLALYASGAPSIPMAPRSALTDARKEFVSSRVADLTSPEGQAQVWKQAVENVMGVEYKTPEEALRFLNNMRKSTDPDQKQKVSAIEKFHKELIRGGENEIITEAWKVYPASVSEDSSDASDLYQRLQEVADGIIADTMVQIDKLKKLR